MVTYPRVKPVESDRDVGGEGWNMESSARKHKYWPTVIIPKGTGDQYGRRPVCLSIGVSGNRIGSKARRPKERERETTGTTH